MAKRSYALATARPSLFYQFSPEAFFLTLHLQNQYLVVLKMKKKRKGLSGRAAGSLACEVAAIGLT
jgi:hypothetical protein